MTITDTPLTGASYDQAYTTVEDVVLPLLDQHSPDYVVGYLASFIASHGLADTLAGQTTHPPIDLDRLEREGEWT